jgi:hypothetical protein
VYRLPSGVRSSLEIIDGPVILPAWDSLPASAPPNRWGAPPGTCSTRRGVAARAAAGLCGSPGPIPRIKKGCISQLFAVSEGLGVPVLMSCPGEERRK